MIMQNYGSLIMAVLAFQVIPGPGTITILGATARKGKGCGMKAVFGTLAGDFIYMLAAVLGLGAILGAYPGILHGVQWFGAVYLCWIGLKIVRTRSIAEPAGAPEVQKDWACFRQALAVSLTNPKVIVFFMAFFPLFLDTRSTPSTLLVLMGHVSALSFFYQTSLVLLGNAVVRRLSRWQTVRMMASRLAGVALIGFGVKLAINNR